MIVAEEVRSSARMKLLDMEALVVSVVTATARPPWLIGGNDLPQVPPIDLNHDQPYGLSAHCFGTRANVIWFLPLATSPPYAGVKRISVVSSATLSYDATTGMSTRRSSFATPTMLLTMRGPSSSSTTA